MLRPGHVGPSTAVARKWHPSWLREGEVSEVAVDEQTDFFSVVGHTGSMVTIHRHHFNWSGGVLQETREREREREKRE